MLPLLDLAVLVPAALLVAEFSCKTQSHKHHLARSNGFTLEQQRIAFNCDDRRGKPGIVKKKGFLATPKRLSNQLKVDLCIRKIYIF